MPHTLALFAKPGQKLRGLCDCWKPAKLTDGTEVYINADLRFANRASAEGHVRQLRAEGNMNDLRPVAL